MKNDKYVKQSDVKRKIKKRFWVQPGMNPITGYERRKQILCNK